MNRASLLQRMSTDTEWRSSCFLLQFPTEDLPCFPYLHALTNSLFLFSFLFSRLCGCQLSCFSQPSTSPAFSNLLPSVFYPLYPLFQTLFRFLSSFLMQPSLRFYSQPSTNFLVLAPSQNPRCFPSLSNLSALSFSFNRS